MSAVAHMSPRQAAAHRRVITAAREIERANQYGLSPKGAVHDYEEARARLRAERRRAAA